MVTIRETLPITANLLPSRQSQPPSVERSRGVFGRNANAVSRYVDMWAMPGMHPSNISFLQLLKSADSNQFTRNMDCVGKISEHDPESGSWTKTHLVGIRTDVWQPDAKELKGTLKALKRQRRRDLKQQIKRSGRLTSKQRQRLDANVEDCDIMQLEADDLISRRLVLKLFKTTGSRVRWVGTLEQTTVSEVHNSIGSNRSLISAAVMLPRKQAVTRIQQNHRTFRLPPVFSGAFYDQDQMWSLMLKRRWVAWGPHFDIYANGQKLGEIDSHVFCFGSDCTLNLKSHELSEDTRLVDTLTLFAASMGYHKAMWRSIRRRVDATRSGQAYRHFIEDEELRLRHNGRAAA